MDRDAAATRYAELPVPSTADEHWRFTDLRGFDPDAYVSDGRVQGSDPETRPGETMLDVDVSGLAVVGENGI